MLCECYESIELNWNCLNIHAISEMKSSVVYILFLISLANSVMPQRTSPLQDAINHILAGRDKNSMLEIKYINPVKGEWLWHTAG